VADALSDVAADEADDVDVLSGGVGEFPVSVSVRDSAERRLDARAGAAIPGPRRRGRCAGARDERPAKSVIAHRAAAASVRRCGRLYRHPLSEEML
jgi:hypothetical protein